MSGRSAVTVGSPNSIGRSPRLMLKPRRRSPNTRQARRRKRSPRGKPAAPTDCAFSISRSGQLPGLGAKGSVPNWVGAYRLTLFKGRQPTEGLPGRVAQCTFTKIKSISDRFGGPLKPPTDKFDSSGTGIIFADGGTQVSYGYVRDIARSRVGDQVLLCLVSIPQNCPPGDDRGRFYSGTNVRTKGSWILPDSQHMCGGA